MMGKKGKNKKIKRKPKKYNKAQFVEIFCNHCKLCGHDPNPSFCYEEMYKCEPVTFINNIYAELLKFRNWLYKQHNVTIDSSFVTSEFKRIFCKSGICGHNNKTNACPDILICYESFRKQFGNAKPNNRKKRGKKHKTVALKAYPTSFFSDNEEWRNTVKEILSDGD